MWWSTTKRPAGSFTSSRFGSGVIVLFFHGVRWAVGISVAHQYDTVAVRVCQLQDASSATGARAVVPDTVFGRSGSGGVEIGLLDHLGGPSGTVGFGPHLETESLAGVPFDQSVHRAGVGRPADEVRVPPLGDPEVGDCGLGE